jgi:hypothetical protein
MEEEKRWRDTGEGVESDEEGIEGMKYGKEDGKRGKKKRTLLTGLIR